MTQKAHKPLLVESNILEIGTMELDLGKVSIYFNGDNYVGGWENNKRNGFGIFTDSRGNIFEEIEKTISSMVRSFTI